MGIWHKGLDRTGAKLGYNEKVAVNLNWWRRCMLGLRTQVAFHSGAFITLSPDWINVSNARKQQWLRIQAAKKAAETALDMLVKEIEEYQTLPIDVEREQKGIAPRKRTKKITEPA